MKYLHEKKFSVLESLISQKLYPKNLYLRIIFLHTGNQWRAEGAPMHMPS